MFNKLFIHHNRSINLALRKLLREFCNRGIRKMLEIIFEVLGVVFFGCKSNIELFKESDTKRIEFRDKHPLANIKLGNY